MEDQRSIEWYRKRLGKITGSRLGDLMKSSRKSDEIFGNTAKSYIYQLAAERNMNPAVIEDDGLFLYYLSQTGFSSKPVEWGKEQELNACELYIKKTGRWMDKIGLCDHPSISCFASSPDGIFQDGNGEIGALEIKCPKQSTFMLYKHNVVDNDSLLYNEPNYFYQCMAHMMCTGANWTDFVVYCPFQSNPIYIVRIKPDKSFFSAIEERIQKANEFIENIIDKIS